VQCDLVEAAERVLDDAGFVFAVDDGRAEELPDRFVAVRMSKTPCRSE
jgi:hypothetical protein